MESAPYVLFRPKSDTKAYVILIYWSTSAFDETCCEIQKRVEVIKQEIAVDNLSLRFSVENVPAAKRQFIYLLNNYICMKTQHDDTDKMSSDGKQQLHSFLKLIGETKSKKRKSESFADV